MDLISDFIAQKNDFQSYIESKINMNNKGQYVIKELCRFDDKKNDFALHRQDNGKLIIHLENMAFEEELFFENILHLVLKIGDNVTLKTLYINKCDGLDINFLSETKFSGKIIISNSSFENLNVNNLISGSIEFR